MSITYKQFASVRPSNADDETELYVVGAGTTVIATVNVCNQGSSSVSYRIGTNQSGTSPIPSADWRVYDKELSANDLHQLTGISLGTGGRINVQTNTANQVSFIADGMEES